MSPGCPALQPDTPGCQSQPMDLRVGQRPTVEPVPEPALLALQHPQRLHRHLFLAGLQQQQRSAEPMRVKTELPRHIPASRTIALSFTPPSLSCRARLCSVHSSQWTRQCQSCRGDSRNKSFGNSSIKTRASEVRVGLVPPVLWVLFRVHHGSGRGAWKGHHFLSCPLLCL